MSEPLPLDYARPRGSSKAPLSFPTFLEVIVVLVLVMVALAVVVPKFGSDRKAARQAAARADISACNIALEDFRRDVGTYPTAAEGLGALYDPPPSATGWNGPYLRKPAIDPWGHPYVFLPATGSTPPRVISPGPDGAQGTADDVAPK